MNKAKKAMFFVLIICLFFSVRALTETLNQQKVLSFPTKSGKIEVTCNTIEPVDQEISDEEKSEYIIEDCSKIKIVSNNIERVYKANISGLINRERLYAITSEKINFMGYIFDNYTQFIYNFGNESFEILSGAIMKYGKTIIPITPIEIKEKINVSEVYILEEDKELIIKANSIVEVNKKNITIDVKGNGEIRNGDERIILLDGKIYKINGESKKEWTNVEIVYKDKKIQIKEEEDIKGMYSACTSISSPEELTGGITGGMMLPMPSIPELIKITEELLKQDCRINHFFEPPSHVKTIREIDWTKVKKGYYGPGDYFKKGTREYEEVIAIQKAVGVTPDGKYGAKTKEAVLKWQKDYNSRHKLKWPRDKDKGAIPEDGLWGPLTTEAYLSEKDLTYTLKKTVKTIRDNLKKKLKNFSTPLKPKERKPKPTKEEEIKIKGIYIVSGKEGDNMFNDLNKGPKEIGPYDKVLLFAVIEDQKGNFYADSKLKEKKVKIKNKEIKINRDIKDILSSKEKKLFLVWYEIYPEISHEGYIQRKGLKKEEVCPLDPDENVPREKKEIYCWYQNVVKTMFWEGGKDIIHYQQKIAQDKIFSPFIENRNIGVKRYRVELLDASKSEVVVSTPGLPNDTLSGIEKSAYDYNLGGISNKVHKIVRRSDFSKRMGKECIGNEFGCSFIDYLEAQYGVVWIFGSSGAQADNEIGMECSHIVRAALRDAGYKKIVYGGVNHLKDSYTSPRIEGKFVFSRTEVVIGFFQEKAQDWWKDITKDKENKEVKIPVGKGENEVHIGDLILIDINQDGRFDHTTVFIADAGYDKGYLDKGDILLNIGHYWEFSSPLERWFKGALAKAVMTIIPSFVIDRWQAEGFVPKGVDVSVVQAMQPRTLGSLGSITSKKGCFVIRKIDPNKIT